ncbi:chain length determinant protein [Pontibacter sp. 172403-2]|uniref:chain length determinant protein n=1 Tax=Pontibacter rufus TaxID=2791028 RepID=UPI0018AFE2BB|nr:chain length determinant protein [Pontibacter sp. 172403-2]MBF9254961.1 chain length determinant protein [Pontibacter sp. 172403-2]
MYQLEERDKHKRLENQDEIDLGVIFERIGRIPQKVGNRLKYTFKAVYNNLKVVSLVVLLGIGLGYAAYYVTKPYYTSSMTLILSNIRNEFMETQLDKLSVMINEDNFEAVSKSLDISPDAAGQIKGMNFYNLDQDRVAEDSILTGSPFRIELQLYNNALFSTMEPALANYLENNRYFSKQKRIRQQQIISLISKYKDEIASLDSVKTAVVNPRGPVNGFVYGQPIDPANLYRESIDMYQRQIALQAELERLDNVEVVTGFVSRLNPTGPKLLKYLLIGALLGFIIGLIIALRREAVKREKLSY